MTHSRNFQFANSEYHDTPCQFLETLYAFDTCLCQRVFCEIMDKLDIMLNAMHWLHVALHSKNKCCYFNTKINTFWLHFSNMLRHLYSSK